MFIDIVLKETADAANTFYNDHGSLLAQNIALILYVFTSTCM